MRTVDPTPGAGQAASSLELPLPRVEVSWSPDRAGAVQRVLVRRHRRRRQLRQGAVASLALVVICGSYVGWQRIPGTSRGRDEAVAVAPSASPASPAATPSVEQGERILRLGDGSVVTLLTAATVVHRVAEEPHRIRLELASGSARFSVSKRPERLFQVAAGVALVEVLGTEFTVERLGEGARVLVHHGRVRVSGAGQERVLVDGESIQVPPAAEAHAPAAAAEPAASATASPATGAAPRERPARTRGREAVAASRPTGEWRRLAESGDFEAAYAALGGRFGSLHGASDLLMAADIARLAHHPDRAVGLLRRVLSAHRSDPRAPLAAFTLGRVLLEELGRPQEAAPVFATARSLATHGPLAEDALAREVEAWSRAGELPVARERATEYVKKYPSGRRSRAVRRHGGLE
jgi:transmembrane sensor